MGSYGAYMAQQSEAQSAEITRLQGRLTEIEGFACDVYGAYLAQCGLGGKEPTPQYVAEAQRLLGIEP